MLVSGSKSRSGQPQIYLHYKVKKSANISESPDGNPQQKSESATSPAASSSDTCQQDKSQSTPRLDPVIYYQYLLKENNGISPVDDEYRAFAIQEIEKGGILVYSMYVP